MPYKRTYSAKKRPGNYRRKFRSARKKVTRVPSVYKYRQIVTAAGLTSTTVASFVGYRFMLQDVDQYATFTALYDSYRIDKIKVTINPMQNSISTPTKNAIFLGYVDPDDYTAPASLAVMREVQNCRVLSTTKQTTFTFKPKCQLEIKNTGGTSNSIGMYQRNPWIDCAIVDVPHYGLKLGIGATAATSDLIFGIDCEYHLSFKNVR